MAGRAGRSRSFGALFLLLLILVPVAGLAQEPAPPAPSETPPAPAAPPAPVPPPPPAPAEPVPVIPERQPIGPPATVPSAPQRLLPVLAVGVPVTATFELTPTLTLTEEYTDNFNLSARDKESNFRSSVSAGLTLLINSPFTKGTVAYSFSPAHDTATGDVSYFHSLVGRVSWQATPRWTLTLADVLTRTDQPSEADQLGLRQERRTFLSNTFSLDSDYLLGRLTTRQFYRMSIFGDDEGRETTSHTLGASALAPLYQTNSISVGYEYLLSTSENGTVTVPGTTTGEVFTSSGATEVRGHRLNTALSRQLTPRSAAGLSGSYALRSVTSDSDDSQFQLWTASLFTSYTSARLTLSGSLGLSGLVTDSGETRGPGLTSVTNLTYRFARAALSLAVNRGFSETFAEGDNQGVVETESITAALSYPFTPLVSGRASGFYRRNTTTGTLQASNGSRDRRNENWGGTLDVSWRVLRNVSLALGYSFLRQEGGGAGRLSGASTQAGVDDGYTENRVRASVGVSF